MAYVGEEIVSGAQRIHDVTLLTERAEHWKVGTHTLHTHTCTHICACLCAIFFYVVSFCYLALADSSIFFSLRFSSLISFLLLFFLPILSPSPSFSLLFFTLLFVSPLCPFFPFFVSIRYRWLQSRVT